MMFQQEDKPSAFVATLGLQPQVITRALDKLLVKDPEIRHGVVIHTGAYRFHPKWDTLETFKKYLDTQYPTITWRWVPIRTDKNAPPLNDVASPDAAQLAFKIIYKELRKLKRQGYRLHKLLAGGRKSIIVYSMVSAQLLFDVQDKLWHIFSDDEHNRETGTRPHVPLGTIHLLEIPVFHLAGLMPMVRELLIHSDDPTRAIPFYPDHEDVEWQVQLQRFFDTLDPKDQLILWLRFANHTNMEVAERLDYAEANIIRRLKKVAVAFLKEPTLAARYPQGFKSSHRDILIALRPILILMDKPPEL